MRTIMFLLICLLASHTSFAETVKERLRRAQVTEENEKKGSCGRRIFPANR